MAKNSSNSIMQHEGLEFGYFDKRKKQFDQELEKGFKNTKPLKFKKGKLSKNNKSVD